jgi:hypothetical protein
MMVFIHQPEYFPWVGFFDKLSECDLCVILDSVQFEDGGFQNRNRIRTREGWRWITVPIVHRFPQRIDEVKVVDTLWRDAHLRMIEEEYRRAQYYRKYAPMVESILSRQWESLAELTTTTIQKVADELGINTRMVLSSSLKSGGKKNELLVGICKEVEGDCYLAGSGGSRYMNEKAFAENGISIRWHKYEHPVYKQAFEGFQPFMSVLDILFNEGENALSIIKSGERPS